MSRFSCTSSELSLPSLLSHTRKALTISFVIALGTHLLLARIRFTEEGVRASRPLTTKFIKREPRLVKPLELKKRPKPKPRPMRRKVVTVKAKMSRREMFQSTAPLLKVLDSLAKPKGGVARTVPFEPVQLEPYFGSAVIEGDKEPEQKVPQARVRLTVDGTTEQFWLEGMKPLIGDSSPQAGQRKVVAGSRRRVAVTLPRDRLDLGFHVHLRKFQRKLDPGTSMPSHYSSLVDVMTPDDNGGRERVRENVLITLNEPGNFSDPHTGRSYRLYQSSFNGPFRPGHPYFDERVGGTGSRDELYLSILSVNYDPGRGLKYFGCLLIVAGIATMYYMKAYFFGKRSNRGGEAASPAAPP